MRLWEPLAWQVDRSAAEIRSQLEAQAEPDTLIRALAFRFDPAGTVFYLGRDWGFRLFAKGPFWLRNSFEPFFYGRTEDDNGRAVIRGTFQLHPLMLVLMTMWLTGVVGIGGLILLFTVIDLVSGTNSVQGDLPQWAGLVAGPVLFSFGLGMVALGWRLGRRQRRAIQAFIESTLQAHRLQVVADGKILFKASLQ